jgi:hypothetical protein
VVSLIQQRMALDRAKNRARILLAVGCLNAATWMVFVIRSDFDSIATAMVIFVVVLFMVGARELHRARKAEADFEAEHGVDAGVQPVIPRTPKL